jgi:hypothetical protein
MPTTNPFTCGVEIGRPILYLATLEVEIRKRLFPFLSFLLLFGFEEDAVGAAGLSGEPPVFEPAPPVAAAAEAGRSSPVFGSNRWTETSRGLAAASLAEPSFPYIAPGWSDADAQPALLSRGI